MIAFITEASGALPQLLEQLEIGRAAEGRRAIADEASGGVRRRRPRRREHHGTVAARCGATAAPPAADVPREPGMDPVLADIFVKEMRGHLEVIRQFLAAATPGGGAALRR